MGLVLRTVVFLAGLCLPAVGGTRNTDLANAGRVTIADGANQPEPSSNENLSEDSLRYDGTTGDGALTNELETLRRRLEQLEAAEQARVKKDAERAAA